MYVFLHHYEYLCGLATLDEDTDGINLVIAQDLIRVIFDDMDPVWLRTMWEDGGSTRSDMIEILISLALLKFRSRL
jgi:hypothetical protein